MKEVPYDPSFLDDRWVFDTLPGETVEGIDPELRERLIDAVESLLEDERAVIECFFWGRYSKTEIAELIGRSRQSVHDVLNRALEQLRTALRPTEEEPDEGAA
ncbi:MAG TPA: sigma factor-like helix-turn-helix DNA-binding protein [Acidimicrobiia bacterium]